MTLVLCEADDREKAVKSARESTMWKSFVFELLGIKNEHKSPSYPKEGFAESGKHVNYILAITGTTWTQLNYRKL